MSLRALWPIQGTKETADSSGTQKPAHWGASMIKRHLSTGMLASKAGHLPHLHLQNLCEYLTGTNYSASGTLLWGNLGNVVSSFPDWSHTKKSLKLMLKDNSLYPPHKVSKVHFPGTWRVCFIKIWVKGFPGGAVVENLPADAGDTGSSPGLGGSHMPRSN